jgi:hypothetical protein
MLRRFLVNGIGALALVGVLEAPGQAHAQCMRGGGSMRAMPMVRGGMMPGLQGGEEKLVKFLSTVGRADAPMPAFELTVDDARAVVAYLRSLPGKR